MMSSVSFKIKIEERAKKELLRIQSPNRKRIRKAIDRLAEYPEHGDALKWDLQELRQVRVGNYRIIYKVQFDVSIIRITLIAHRKEVYRSKYFIHSPLFLTLACDLDGDAHIGTSM